MISLQVNNGDSCRAEPIRRPFDSVSPVRRVIDDNAPYRAGARDTDTTVPCYSSAVSIWPGQVARSKPCRKARKFFEARFSDGGCGSFRHECLETRTRPQIFPSLDPRQIGLPFAAETTRRGTFAGNDLGREVQSANQSSRTRPGTRPNSLTLFVTSGRPRATACPAMRTSNGPISVPCLRR